MVLDAGFEGAFDLELMGPRIEDEGYASVYPPRRRAIQRIARTARRLSGRTREATMADEVRVGVIGTGFGGAVVAAAFAATDGCTVVDVVTPRDADAVVALCRATTST